MHPWPSCNGRTRNAVSMSIWVCIRPHYFYCPSPDFTTSNVSQSVTNNRCAPSCGGHKRKVRGHIKKFSAGASRRHCAPHLQIATDATEQYFFVRKLGLGKEVVSLSLVVTEVSRGGGMRWRRQEVGLQISGKKDLEKLLRLVSNDLSWATNRTLW